MASSGGEGDSDIDDYEYAYSSGEEDDDDMNNNYAVDDDDRMDISACGMKVKSDEKLAPTPKSALHRGTYQPQHRLTNWKIVSIFTYQTTSPTNS
jgi:hypothetical protein